MRLRPPRKRLLARLALLFLAAIAPAAHARQCCCDSEFVLGQCSAPRHCDSGSAPAALCRPLYERFPGYLRFEDVAGRRAAQSEMLRWLDTPLRGGPFRSELNRAYQERADFFHFVSPERSDARQIKVFAHIFKEKGERAQKGEDIEPFDVEAAGLRAPPLLAARRATIEQAEIYSSVAPLPCAQAIALFDQWAAAHALGAGTLATQSKEDWAAAWGACFSPIPIYGFTVDSCLPFDDDAALPDEPEPGLNQRTKLEQIAKSFVALERAGVLSSTGLKIRIEGHTSTIDTFARNQEISMCRARAVADLMVAQGARLHWIEFVALGETQLEVPTSDVVTDYRNRRVVVSLMQRR